MTDGGAHDRHWMQRALDLAVRGLYTTRENPRVGCVLVKHDQWLAEGYHQVPGGPHAEICALAGVPEGQASGATCYVTLEPCAHQGKTGPCTEALIAAGVERVVVAMEDPNPVVAGRGIEQLRAAGIEVDVGLLADQAAELNLGFVRRMTQQLPWVWLKSAASLDGKTAMADGESKWITGVEARADVQRLRARVGAIITGIETVLTDDPALTVRPEEAHFESDFTLPERQPLRVILDSRGRLPQDARLLAEPGDVLWVTTAAVTHPALASGRLMHWRAPADAAGRVDLQALLHHLAALQCNEVLVESGATLAGAFIGQDLVDGGVLYLAGKLLGPAGRSLYDVAPAQLSDAPRVLISNCQSVGEDLRIDWRRRND